MVRERSSEGAPPSGPGKTEGGEGGGGQVRRRYLVRGRVQGVFYRAWTQEVATELGLRGRVRNLPDGAVEILAGGSREAMETFERRLWKGPPAARVEAVEVLELDQPLDDGPFRIVR